MSSILIVDDEYYLVQGVKSSLDWQSLGITQIYEAYSAERPVKSMNSTRLTFFWPM